MKKSFYCLFCERNSTIQDIDVSIVANKLIGKNNAEGEIETLTEIVVCPNPYCKRISLSVNYFEYDKKSPDDTLRKRVLKETWNLIPLTNAKHIPEYVPNPIIEDYQEACSILNLSPKASATLSRRCLQGMIRDFFKVSKSRLIDEIEAIKDKVDSITWKSIDAVRKIGNIGAHMEKDINIIVDVDPNEAAILIQLIEQLMNDWYVNRHERELRHQEIIKISQSKDVKKSRSFS